MKVSRSSAWRIGILFAAIAIVSSISVNKPAAFGSNRFLQAFMGPDFVSVLVVMLTITFGSVANVHLSISRLVAAAPDPMAARTAAKGARDQINTNAWALFWAFAVAIVSLIVNGEYPQSLMVQSVTTAINLIILLINGLVMHDIYRSIFILVATEIPTKDRKHDEQDYAQNGARSGED